MEWRGLRGEALCEALLELSLQEFAEVLRTRELAGQTEAAPVYAAIVGHVSRAVASQADLEARVGRQEAGLQEVRAALRVRGWRA